MRKLNNNILFALAQYFFHHNRSKRNFCPICGQKLAIPDQFKWDKSADLDRIVKMANKYGWGMQATAGMFWFDRRTKAGNKIVIQVNENNYMEGGVRILEKVKK